MRISSSTKRPLLVGATVVILTGCSSGASLLGQSRSAQQSAVKLSMLIPRNGPLPSPVRIGVPIVHKDRHKSQMFNVKREVGARLLYVTDPGTDDVQVYNYPSNGTQISPAGTLTGFNFPYGECVDTAKHEVFIANEATAQIFQFAYGATSPTLVINDPGEFPVGCSVDPTTGNLAVSNIGSAGSGPGSVSVYTPPFTDSPKIYSDSNPTYEFFDSYDTSGDLFIDGFTSAGAFQLSELSAGTSTFTDLSISNSIAVPGGVNFDAQRGYVVVNDQGAAAAYGYVISGSTATLAETIPLTGSSDIAQAFLKPGLTGIVAPDAGNGSANTYRYPSGGSPQSNKVITNNLVEPIGASILKP